MDTKLKDHWVKIALGLAVGAVSVYVLYKLTRSSSRSAVTVDPFKDIIDQRAND
jgi:hypothetical protein